LPALIARVDRNFAVLDDFVRKTPWIENLAKSPETRSNTSVCLSITDPDLQGLDTEAQVTFAKAIVRRLEKEGAAYDIDAYRDAPSGLRIWTGATVEAADLKVLTEWLDWAFSVEKVALKKAIL